MFTIGEEVKVKEGALKLKVTSEPKDGLFDGEVIERGTSIFQVGDKLTCWRVVDFEKVIKIIKGEVYRSKSSGSLVRATKDSNGESFSGKLIVNGTSKWNEGYESDYWVTKTFELSEVEVKSTEEKELQYYQDKEKSDEQRSGEIINSLKSDNEELLSFVKSLTTIMNSYQNYDKSTIGYQKYLEHKELIKKFKK
jgi:hypothetical protein